MKLTLVRIFSSLVFAAGALTAGCDQGPGTSTSNTQASPGGAVASQGSSVHNKDILVTVTVRGPGVVELALPITPDGKRLHFGDVTRSSGDWTETFGGDRIQSTTQGSMVSFHVTGDKPAIAFLQNPNGADVSISYNGITRSISLHAEKYDWRPEPLNQAL